MENNLKHIISKFFCISRINQKKVNHFLASMSFKEDIKSSFTNYSGRLTAKVKETDFSLILKC